MIVIRPAVRVMLRHKAIVPVQLVQRHVPIARPVEAVRGSWTTDRRKTIYLFAVVLGLCLMFQAIYLQIIWHNYAGTPPGHKAAFGDFFALWTYAKIASDQSVVALYDMAGLHDRQVALGMDPAALNPFPYPPTAMFLFWPLGWLPYEMSYLAWITISLALFMLVVRRTCTGTVFLLLFVILSPASTGNIFQGQSGFLAAALLIGGLRLAPTRPLISGLLLGFASYKPQLALLVPIALASGRLWAAFAAASATVAGLVLAATLVCGAEAWRAWYLMLPSYARLVDASTSLQAMPIVVANLRMLGLPLTLANYGQLFAAIAVAMLLARCFRRNAGRLGTAALLAGCFLAAPHAFFYDLPMVAAAIVLFIQARLDGDGGFTTSEVAVLVLAALFPIAMLLKDCPIPVSTVPLALLFAVIVREHGRLRDEAA